MRLRNGNYECILCGTVLNLATELEPRVTITTASGQSAMRIISYDGRPIHSCPLLGEKTAQVPSGT